MVTLHSPTDNIKRQQQTSANNRKTIHAIKNHNKIITLKVEAKY